jgi:hypothetical protein
MTTTRYRPRLSRSFADPAGALPVIFAAVSPTPSPSTLKAPPPGGLQVAGALLAIAFAVAAAILGYRIIRGGRGL